MDSETTTAMASRIILGGRQLGTGRYGGSPLCLCGELVAILGRCLDCHEALRRRRVGLPPADKAEAKRLAGWMEKYQASTAKCRQCGQPASEPHDERCVYAHL